MRTTTLVVTLGFLLVVIPCRAAEKGAEHRERIGLRLGNQEGRLQDIDELISRQRQDIEQEYKYRLDTLVEEYARRFKRAHMAQRDDATILLWAEFLEFIKQAGREPEPVSSSSEILEPFIINSRAHMIRRALNQSYLLVMVQEFLTYHQAQELVAKLASCRNYPQLVRKEAWQLLDLARRFELDAEYLRNRREARLAALEQRERELKEGVYRVMREIRAKAEKPQAGVVSAIGYTEKKAYCMVEGADRILAAGEIIDNVVIKDVKVAGIDRDKVEFEKDGRRWTQKVGQKPKAEYWK